MLKAQSADQVRDAFAVLRAGAESGRLAHGYVISCSSIELGKELAVLMLQWLQCEDFDKPCGQCRSCVQIAARVHPDFHWLEPESKSRVIKIDQVRSLNHTISQKSYQGGWKAGVLLHADRLNDNAANAFLKTLEEPPAKSLLLLITENAQELLPTIISRCQRVNVGAGSAQSGSKIEAAMLEWLRGRDNRTTTTEQAAWIVSVLGEVRSRAESDEKESAAQSGEEIEKDLLKARVQARSIEARMEIMRVLYRWERDIMICSMGGSAETLFYPDEKDVLTAQGEGLKPAELMSRLKSVEQVSRILERNVPEMSVLESLLPV